MYSIKGLKPKRQGGHTGTTDMRKRKALSRFHLAGIVVVAIATVAVFMFWRAQGTGLEQARAARLSAIAARPRGQGVSVTAGPSQRTITLLAGVRPFVTAILYAKVSRSLQSLKGDKGETVNEGQ